ncbi:glycosyltransferase [Chloropicon primus]|nr:glycosyltransferase [Chloropicon primus]
MKRTPSFERLFTSPKQWNLFFIFVIFVLAVFSIRTVDTRRKIDFSIEYGLFGTRKDLSHGSLEVTLKTLVKKDGPQDPVAVPDIEEICPHAHYQAERSLVGSSNGTASAEEHIRVLQGAGSRQRIALYTGAYNHIRDGVSMTLNRMVKYLLAQGHEVLVLAPTNSHPVINHAGKLSPVPSLQIPGRGDYQLSTFLTKELKEELEEFRPTVVHIATPDPVGWQVQKWAVQHEIAIACSFHTHFTSYMSYYGLGFLENYAWDLTRKFYNQCHHTYVPSYGIADELRHHGVKHGLLLWTRGVDTDVYSPRKKCPALRQKLKIKNDEPVVLLACRLVWEKGLQVYVDVIKRLEAQGIKHKSVVAGDGPARAKMQQLLPNTIFLGAQKPEQLSCTYASSDVYIFPSRTETFGVTIAEAMASGLPVVVANASGPAMMVKHGVNGYMAPPTDSKVFFDYAKELVTDSELRQRMSKSGREIAVQTFHWSEVFNNLVNYYDVLAEAISPR